MILTGNHWIPSWTFLRSENDFAAITSSGELKVNLQPATISELTSPSFLGRRVAGESFDVIMDMRLDRLVKNEEAGLVLLADNEDHLKVVFDKDQLRVTERENGEETELVSRTYQRKNHQLVVKSRKQRISIYWVNGDGKKVTLVEDIPARSLSNFRYTGVFVGPYASSNGEKTKNAFYVDRFEYSNKG